MNELKYAGDGEEHSYGRDEVIKIINSVIGKMQANGGTATLDSIYEEIKALKDIIEDAKKDLSSARAGEISSKHIPLATDELDAVVEATAEATGAIMDSCEAIQKKAAGGDAALAQDIDNEVMKIYEACSFQDITGQRITKVVKTLTQIDEKVSALMEVLGNSLPGLNDGADSEEEQPTGDAALLNGPQLPDKAITQDDIDKLLAEFD